MLRGLHKASGTMLGKWIMAGVMGLIAASFAVWGIGDVFRGFGLSTVAKVGKSEIGVEQFRQAYSERVQQLSRRIGRAITPDQARALGLDRQMLGQMLAEAALDQNASALGLGLSDAEIAKRVMTDANFRGATGQFDRTRFEQVIRQAGYNEPRYVAEQRRVSLRRQIGDTVAGSLTVPKSAIDAQNRFDNEERSVDYVVLGPAQAGDVPEAAPDVLEKYYNDHKILFRAPEYRKVDLLIVTPAELSRWMDIPDADARKVYDQQRARFVTPERREVEQIVFPNAEEARAAAERLEKGTTFEQLAADRGLKASDFNLGTIAKTALLDPAVADAAFALKPGTVSGPVAGRFGTVLVRVGKIEPEQVRAFEDLAPEIKRNIALERAKQQILDTRDKIEDERGANLPLGQIAEKLKLPHRSIAAVDRSGRDPEGNPVSDLPAGIDVLPRVFSTDVGAENDPLDAPGGGYVYYDVLSVTPSRDRPFAEVKDRVTARWRDDEISARLKTRATELVDKLKITGANDALAVPGLTTQSSSGLKRNKAVDAIPLRVVEEIFRTPQGAAATAEMSGPTERIVFRVKNVTIPTTDPTTSDGKRIADALRNSYSEELLAQYVLKLETDLGTSVNEAALNQALGAGSGGAN